MRRQVAFGSSGEERSSVEDLFEVADEGDVDADVLVDLGGVDLDVDLLRVGRVAGEVAGDAVVEAHPEGEQEVGLLDGVVDPGLAVHAHHAERERVMRRGRRRGRAAWWRRGSAGVRRRRGPRASAPECDDAVAGEDDGLLGGLDELDGLLDGGGFGAQHGVRAVGRGGGGVEVEERGGLLGVLGDVDEDGAGAAGLRDLEGLADAWARCPRRG